MPPLSGITVVSIEQAVSAPFATRQLADLGARVVKVERPDTGDFARSYDGTVRGMSAYFVWINRSKESLTLDLKHPMAPEVMERLVDRADVLVQNLAPGAADRLGLSFEKLRQDHPRLIVCDISGYGDEGPCRNKKAYDLLIQSEAGLLSVTGTPEMWYFLMICRASPIFCSGWIVIGSTIIPDSERFTRSTSRACSAIDRFL